MNEEIYCGIKSEFILYVYPKVKRLEPAGAKLPINPVIFVEFKRCVRVRLWRSVPWVWNNNRIE